MRGVGERWHLGEAVTREGLCVLGHLAACPRCSTDAGPRDGQAEVHRSKYTIGIRMGFTSLVALTALSGSAVLWVAGLRLFFRSPLSPGRKAGWAAFLVLAGTGMGILLPSDWIWSRYLVLVGILPGPAVADVWLFRRGRGVWFWVRACGLEVCTVFGTAGLARYCLDLAGATPVVRHTQ